MEAHANNTGETEGNDRTDESGEIEEIGINDKDKNDNYCEDNEKNYDDDDNSNETSSQE